MMSRYDEALEHIIDMGIPSSGSTSIDRRITKTLKEALEKAKAFDQIVEAINYEFLHARNVDNWPYGSDEKHNLKIRATDFWSKINKLCANLTEKYIKEE